MRHDLKSRAIATSIKNRKTNNVQNKVIMCGDMFIFQISVQRCVERGTRSFTDDVCTYRRVKYYFYELANHSVDKHVRSVVRANNIDSFCVILKRTHAKTFYNYLNRCVRSS